LTNYAAYIPPGGKRPRIGHLDLETGHITPLSYVSGTAVRDLYEVIEAGKASFVQDGEPFPRSEARLLPPIYGRDILAVGKNYAVRESTANSGHGYWSPDRLMPKSLMPQGKWTITVRGCADRSLPRYDSSDKVDMPTHPVIFTKRWTSAIADGDEIFPHPGFTESVDYEGEIGVIVGKAGFKISQSDAFDHVWGFTVRRSLPQNVSRRD
jgi:hypothetical protein